MKSLKESWKETKLSDTVNISLSLITLFFTIAGFIMVIKSLRSSEKIASTSTYLQTYAWTVDVDKVFIESPLLKGYLYGDTTKLKADENYNENRAKLDAVAELTLDSYDAVLNNESYFKIDTLTGNLWMTTVKTSFKRSSFLRKKYELDSVSYSPQLKKAYMDSQLLKKIFLPV